MTKFSSSLDAAGEIHRSTALHFFIQYLWSHIHVSLRDESGKNIFAVTDDELKNGGRKSAKYQDTKYISQECEWFLAGILDGIQDGPSLFILGHVNLLIYKSSDAHGKRSAASDRTLMMKLFSLFQP